MIVVLLASFLSSFGYFFLMAVMAILLLDSPFHFSAGQIAVLLGLLGFADGFAPLWAPIIQHLTYRQAILIALPGAACALFGIALFPQFWCCAVFLCTLGVVNSLGSLAVRLWISSIVDEREKAMGFSSLYRISNAAGGLTPLLVFALPYMRYGQYIFAASGVLYMCATLVVFMFFKDQSCPHNQPSSIKELVKSLVTDYVSYKKCLPVLFVLFSFTYFYTPYLLLPYYYKQYGHLPSYIGFIMALNPILIVLFQGRFSKLAYGLYQRRYALSAALAFALIGAAFFIMYLFSQLFGVCLFVVFVTIAEMLLGPQIDFLLSQRAPMTIKPLVFALSGIVWAFGRSAGESGGITFLNALSIHAWNTSLWWVMNGFLAMVIASAAIWRLVSSKIASNSQSQSLSTSIPVLE